MGMEEEELARLRAEIEAEQKQKAKEEEARLWAEIEAEKERKRIEEENLERLRAEAEAEEKNKFLEEASKIIEQAKAAEALLETEFGPNKSRALVRELHAQVSSLQVHTTSIVREVADSVATTSAEKEDKIEGLAVSQTKSQKASVTNERTVDATEPGVIAAGA